MKRIVMAIAMAFVSSTAFAGGGGALPHSVAIDEDKDGAFIAPYDVNGDGKVDHADIGVKASAYDCDDVYDTVSPLLTEIVGNKIDDDCSSTEGGTKPLDHVKGDATWPVKDAELTLWKANWPIPWSDLGFIASHGRLSAKDSHVTVVKLASGEEAGTFKKEDGYQVGDWISGSLPTDREFSAVDVKADGILEVFTDNEVKHVQKLQAAAKPRYSGPSKETRTKEAAEVATPLVEAEAEARLAADDEHDARIADNATAIDQLDRDTAEAITAMIETHTAIAKVIEEEEKARKEADADEARARKEADEAARLERERIQREVDAHSKSIRDMESKGIYLAYSPGVCASSQQELTNGDDVVRSAAFMGFCQNGTIGYVKQGRFMVGVSGSNSVGTDFGLASARGYGLQVENLWRIPTNQTVWVGPTLSASRHTTDDDDQQLAAVVVGDRYGLGAKVFVPITSTDGKDLTFGVTAFFEGGPESVHWANLPGNQGRLTRFFSGGIGVAGSFSTTSLW